MVKAGARSEYLVKTPQEVPGRFAYCLIAGGDTFVVFLFHCRRCSQRVLKSGQQASCFPLILWSFFPYIFYFSLTVPNVRLCSFCRILLMTYITDSVAHR